MTASLAGTLRQPSSGPPQVPAHELANDSCPVMPYRSGRRTEVAPIGVIYPNASDLVLRHGRGVYGAYVGCRTASGKSHGCSVCRLYVRFNYLNSTKRPQAWTASGALRDNRNPEGMAVHMSVDTISRPRETSIVLDTHDRASDLDYPQCEQHWSAATFAIQTEQHERALYCDRCVADGIRAALLAGGFTPACLSPVDLDTYKPWQVAS